MIYFKKTVFSPNIPTLIYKSFHLSFFKRWLCIQLMLEIILWDFASVEKKTDAAKKDCTVVYKLLFLKTYLLQWRVYIGFQENLHPKKTFYVFQPQHYWQLGPYINAVVQVTGYTSSL